MLFRSEFTEGFEHCLDLLVDLGRLPEGYNNDGRISAMLNVDGSQRQLAEIGVSDEELLSEEFWHLVSQTPNPAGNPRPKYPSWFPRVLRCVDIRPEGSVRDYTPNNLMFHRFEGEVAWSPQSAAENADYEAMLRTRTETGLSNTLRFGDPGDGSVLPPDPELTLGPRDGGEDGGEDRKSVV